MGQAWGQFPSVGAMTEQMARRWAGASARRVGSTLGATAMVVSIGMLSACVAADRGVTIPPGYDQLEQCVPTTIDAEELSSLGEPGCDLVGSAVLLPDGTSLDINEVGVVSAFGGASEPATEHILVNWGIPGVAVSVIKAERLVDQWQTSPGAAELQRQQLLISGYDD